jgi:hypothetical protein
MSADDIDMAVEIADSLDDLKAAHEASNIVFAWRGQQITALRPTDPSRQVLTMDGTTAGVTGNLYIAKTDMPAGGADGDSIVITSHPRQPTLRIAGIIDIAGAILEIGLEDNHVR